ncbi:DUF2635 domain-containing protein [Chromobacterium vaccinii]|uniref:DUF2635 domain-containing protein n=1 Tax=Chromobacterium vaccinii TaxID=1108595 RepID=UPI003C74E136
MKVIAAPGVQVPLEGQPRRYISDSVAVDVPDTPYYRLRLRDQDLTHYQEDATAPAPARAAAQAAPPADKPAAPDKA